MRDGYQRTATTKAAEIKNQGRERSEELEVKHVEEISPGRAEINTKNRRCTGRSQLQEVNVAQRLYFPEIPGTVLGSVASDQLHTCSDTVGEPGEARQILSPCGAGKVHLASGFYLEQRAT